MLSFGLFLSFAISLVSGDGEFVVLRSPKALEFSGSEEIDGHIIPEIIAASLGFTVKKGSNWPGVTVRNPFGYADAVVVVNIGVGLSRLAEFRDLPVFTISPSQDEFKSWKTLHDETLLRFPRLDNQNLARIRVNGDKNVEYQKTTFLNEKIDEDLDFLQEIGKLKAFVDAYKKNVSIVGEPQITWLVVTSLQALAARHGKESDTMYEAEDMLRKEILELSEAVGKAFNEKALVLAITDDGSRSRHTRAADGSEAKMPLNRAAIYTKDYPAMFNIILWFSIVFIFALIATSYFIATMDPGRDSIIYRMTSNRMKKDS